MLIEIAVITALVVFPIWCVLRICDTIGTMIWLRRNKSKRAKT